MEKGEFCPTRHAETDGSVLQKSPDSFIRQIKVAGLIGKKIVLIPRSIDVQFTQLIRERERKSEREREREKDRERVR